MISRILSDYLQKEHDIELKDAEGNIIDKDRISAEELISRTITAVLMRGDAASKGMIDSLAAITEGSKINLEASITTGKLTKEERKARIDALKAKLD
jgi:hypothetical protein